MAIRNQEILPQTGIGSILSSIQTKMKTEKGLGCDIVSKVSLGYCSNQ